MRGAAGSPQFTDLRERGRCRIPQRPQVQGSAAGLTLTRFLPLFFDR